MGGLRNHEKTLEIRPYRSLEWLVCFSRRLHSMFGLAEFLTRLRGLGQETSYGAQSAGTMLGRF